MSMSIRKTIIIWLGTILVLSGVIFFVGTGNTSERVNGVNEVGSVSFQPSPIHHMYQSTSMVMLISQHNQVVKAGLATEPQVIHI